jgi:hypothetical protein
VTANDAFEARAQQAARSAHHSVRGIDMTGLTAQTPTARLRAPSRTLLVVAASIVLLLLVGALVGRNVLTSNEGVPAFEPQPLPGARPFHSHLVPSVSFRIPPKHLASPDQADLTVVKFDGIPTGGLIAMRVRTYANGDRRSLAAAVAADDRLKVLRRDPAVVGGEPATRLVVRPVPGITASDWFCPTGDLPCFTLDPTGQTTLYLFKHQGTRYLLSGGAINDSGATQLQTIVDGAAATWHW